MDYRTLRPTRAIHGGRDLPPLHLASRGRIGDHQPAGARWDQRDRGAGHTRTRTKTRIRRPREPRAIRATREALGQAPAAARGIPARGTRSAVRGWSVRRRRATRPRGMRDAARGGAGRRHDPDQPTDGDRRERRVLWRPTELLDRRGLHLRRPALPDRLRLHRLRPAHGAGGAHDHPAAGRHLRVRHRGGDAARWCGAPRDDRGDGRGGERRHRRRGECRRQRRLGHGR